MKCVVVGLVLAACLVGAFAEEASKVEVLTAENFDEKTKEGLWLVKFFAPWCGHCKRLAPTWEQFAADSKDAAYTVAEVDCTVQRELCQKYSVTGYPTILYVAAGAKPSEFNGPRTKEALQKWAASFAEKAHSEL